MVRRLWWAFLRFFFRLLYNELAWTYDAVAWLVSLGRWKTWGRAAIPHLQGERVLELAHGPGHLLVAMADRHLMPVGLDLSRHMSQLARRRLNGADAMIQLGERSHRIPPLVRACAQRLPFCDNAFDSVVSAFPTKFIVDPATLREAARVLRLTGRLVVVAGAYLNEADLLSRFIRWLYSITRQGDLVPNGAETILVEAGFVPSVVRESLGRSQVALIVADKCSRATQDDRIAGKNGLSAASPAQQGRVPGDQRGGTIARR